MLIHLHLIKVTLDHGNQWWGYFHRSGAVISGTVARSPIFSATPRVDRTGDTNAVCQNVMRWEIVVYRVHGTLVNVKSV